MTKLIPRQLLFSAPDRAKPSLSPDGRQMAWLAQENDVLNLHVAPRGQLDAARQVTFDREIGVQIYSWCFDNRHILFLQNPSGDENWHVFKLDLDTGEQANLTPWDGAASGIHSLSPEMPGRVIVTTNRRSPSQHDLISIDLASGQHDDLYRNTEGFVSLITDRQLALRFGMAALEGGAMRYFQRVEGGWEPFLDVPAEDVLTTRLTGVTRDDKGVYAVDSRGRDKARLVRIALDDRSVTELAAPAEADVSEVLAHPETNALLAYTTMADRRTWHAVAPDTMADLDVLHAAHPGDLHIQSRSLDLGHWMVAYTQDAGAAQFALYDRAQNNVSVLFSAKTALDTQPLVPMAAIHVTARDGLDIPGYLSLPRGRAVGDGGAAMPFVMLVHGGPWGRVVWGYDAATQWLANRGFAVLSPNFRGSAGFGKAFLNAGDRQWGAAMQDDLLDVAQWAIDNGIADPRRLAIFGASYGGYAVLRALTSTPDIFACGVAMCPPADLVGFLENVPPYWANLRETFARRIGDPLDPASRAILAERSPVASLDRLSVPLFLAHGANDIRVAQADSDRVAAHLESRNIPYLYALFRNEGHILSRPENTAAFFALAEQFLGAVLGTRAEALTKNNVALPELVLTGSLLPKDGWISGPLRASDQ